MPRWSAPLGPKGNTPNGAGLRGSPLEALSQLLPIPTKLLFGGRFNQMGFNGASPSNGTDRTSASIIASVNETGATVTHVEVILPNWYMDSNAEASGLNSLTVDCVLEYVTQTPVVTGQVVAIDENFVTLEVALSTPVPPDASLKAHTVVSVGAGGKWPRGYLIRTANGEKSAVSTTPGAFTAGVDFTNSGATAYGPLAINATRFSGTPRRLAMAAWGDSGMMGSGDSPADGAARGNVGPVAKATVGKFPCINMGIAGHRAALQVGNMSRRADALTKIAVTVELFNYTHNDLGAGRTPAQLTGDLQVMWNAAAARGHLVAQATCGPRSTSTDGWQTVENQTPNVGAAYTGGAASYRGIVNSFYRSLPAPLWKCLEWADALEPFRDAGVFGATSSFSPTHLTASGTQAAATGDGLHVQATSTTPPGLGGVYILKDAFVSQFTQWQSEQP